MKMGVCRMPPEKDSPGSDGAKASIRRDSDEAWQSLLCRPLLQEEATLEPDLVKVLQLARNSPQVRGYSRLRRYDHLKYLASLFVGDYARRDELATHEHYDAV